MRQVDLKNQMVEENKTEESNEQKWLIKIAFSPMVKCRDTSTFI
jgi:hypothetical protein